MNIKNILKRISSSIPDMNEETATMLTKYNKICTRKDIVDKFIKELNSSIYGRSRLGCTTYTISNIPQEVVPELNNIVKNLQTKGFNVGLLTKPYHILAIKWDEQ